MQPRPDDICPHEPPPREMPTAPHRQPIYLSTVYECEDPRQAGGILAGETEGFVYSRDGHPNAISLAEQLRQLHQTERAEMTSSGMSAMAAALLSQTTSGDHLIVSRHLYGKSIRLFTHEAVRFGLDFSMVDTNDLQQVKAAFRPKTRLVIVETITNPLLHVSDLPRLSEITHQHGALLLVDNTLASPTVCRPSDWGADLVLESLTKICNGHSDVLLGLLCGREAIWERVPEVISCWGFNGSPMDCYLAQRGLGTLAVRSERASSNALELAHFLVKLASEESSAVKSVHYPGLPTDISHDIATRLFQQGSGSVVTFTLAGGIEAAERFISAIRPRIAFCPSLGELSTTLSHPASTSHRGLSSEEQRELTISEGMIRISVGIESSEYVIGAISDALANG